MSDGSAKFFGGSPLGVIVRLVLLSIVIGVLLAALGLDPRNIWHSIDLLVQRVMNMGLDAIGRVWGYFLLGAVIVIPIWIIVRLLRMARGKP